jgi:hypothetical protein
MKCMDIIFLLTFVHSCRCYTCGGSGLLECEVCDTNGQLKCYIKLTVTWTTHKNDHVVERTALPDQLIRGAQGQLAFSDQRQRVIPVMTFPDRAVNDASQLLIRSHSISFRNERILMQVDNNMINLNSVHYYYSNFNTFSQSLQYTGTIY